MNTADFFACDYQSVNCISKEKQHCIPIRKATTVINEGEVPYGTKGRVRPDYYKDGFCVDIKNYNVESASGRSNLARNIEKQYYQRIEMILSILVYTLFSRMFDLMQPPVVKHSIAVA